MSEAKVVLVTRHGAMPTAQPMSMSQNPAFVDPLRSFGAHRSGSTVNQAIC